MVYCQGCVYAYTLDASKCTEQQPCPNRKVLPAFIKPTLAHKLAAAKGLHMSLPTFIRWSRNMGLLLEPPDRKGIKFVAVRRFITIITDMEDDKNYENEQNQTSGSDME